MRKKVFTRLALVLGAVALMGQGCVSFSFGGKGGAAPGGVFKSADKGENWAQRVEVLAVGGKKASFGSADIVTLAFDPQDANAIYAGTLANGVFYSYDGGASWQQPGAIKAGRVGAIAIDPKDKCTIYVAIGNRVGKSTDCNRSWFEIYVGPSATQVVNAITVDSFNPKIVYMGVSTGEVVKSTDGGGSWAVANRFQDQVKKILISKRDTRVLIVATAGRGIWRSDNSGAEWKDISEGMKPYSGSGTFRDMVIWNEDTDGLLLASQYGLLLSPDGGATWQPIPLLTPPGGASIFATASNPQNPNEIYYATASTFYKTVNGGKNWVTKKLPTKRQVTVLTVDPVNPAVLYMGVLQVKQ